MKESDWQKELIKSCERRHAVVFNCHGHAMQASGWPDLWIGMKGLSGWFELKVNDRALTIKQEQRIRMLRRVGVCAVVLRLITANNVVQAEDHEGVVEHRYNGDVIEWGWIVDAELMRWALRLEI